MCKWKANAICKHIAKAEEASAATKALQKRACKTIARVKEI
jgi:hypothetical protein